MKINIFAGARRTALAVGFLWVVGCLCYAVFSTPYVSLTYAVAWPGRPATKVERCLPEDASQYVSAKTTKGQTVGVELCFIAHDSQDGRRLVPYPMKMPDVRLPDGTVVTFPVGLTKEEVIAQLGSEVPLSANREALLKALPNESPATIVRMNEPHTTEVMKYTEAVSARFSLPSADLPAIDEQLWHERLEQWKAAGMALVAGLAIGWALVAGVGRIVRGFMGIPRAADKRPEAA